MTKIIKLKHFYIRLSKVKTITPSHYHVKEAQILSTGCCGLAQCKVKWVPQDGQSPFYWPLWFHGQINRENYVNTQQRELIKEIKT